MSPGKEVVMFMMRFAMRAGSVDASERADLYAATLAMCAWAEDRGCAAAVVSQHHGVEDGYLPSPLPLAAAIAARTSTLAISVAALLVALYEPVKLAEDLAVIDLIGRGRVSYVVGVGYRPEEFAMFGIDPAGRGRLVEDRITLLRRLWAGETIEVEGRPVRVTPLPFTPGGPMLAYGGGSELAARRAGRLGMFFVAESHDAGLERAYNEAAAQAGVTPLGCMFPAADVPLTVFVAEDPDQAWDEVGMYLLRDALSYASWNADRPGTASVSFATTVSELRAEPGAYQIITPDEARAYAARGTLLGLQPLVGGLPPDIAWRYLETAAAVTGSG
jgi:alkanesulfonate monooxygenase SsuD/methylene tetrahydromethanopterin reductase-like flavin-dependent oxidoreductase (luciferase family)